MAEVINVEKIMDEIKGLGREKADLKVRQRRADSFSEQVELNIKIKELQMEIELLQDKLK